LGTKDLTISLRRMSSLVHASNVEAKLGELARAVETKYDPDQPRVPAGNPDGGQWTDAGAGGSGGSSGSVSSSTVGSGDVRKIIAFAARKRVAGSPLNYQRCLDLCYPLLERPQHPSSDRNTWDFHKCMNACLQRNL